MNKQGLAIMTQFLKETIWHVIKLIMKVTLPPASGEIKMHLYNM